MIGQGGLLKELRQIEIRRNRSCLNLLSIVMKKGQKEGVKKFEKEGADMRLVICLLLSLLTFSAMLSLPTVTALFLFLRPFDFASLFLVLLSIVALPAVYESFALLVEAVKEGWRN